MSRRRLTEWQVAVLEALERSEAKATASARVRIDRVKAIAAGEVDGSRGFLANASTLDALHVLGFVQPSRFSSHRSTEYRLTPAGREWVESGRCTGVTARWCPLCGTCSCPRPEGRPYDDDPQHLDDPSCPLHAPTSEHAEP